MKSSPLQSARRWLLLSVCLALGALAILYLRRSGQAGQALPRIDEISRLHVYLDLTVADAEHPTPPGFDVPPSEVAAIAAPLNAATPIKRPATSLNVGRVEAWYRDGESVRVDLFLVATSDMSLASKDLVLSTSDGVWRRAGKYVDFMSQAQKAFQAGQAKAP